MWYSEICHDGAANAMLTNEIVGLVGDAIHDARQGRFASQRFHHKLHCRPSSHVRLGYLHRPLDLGYLFPLCARLP